MPALIRLLQACGAVRVRGVLWLAFLGVLLRAVVPAGYMPDARALHDGRLEVTFCSAAGDLSTFKIALSADGKTADGTGDHRSAETGAQCPFGLLAHVTPAPTPYVAPLALAAGRHAPAPAPTPDALPVQPAQGPPLGSRAPPFVA